MLGAGLSQFRFADPWYLSLLLILPLLAFRQRWSQKHSEGGLCFPQVKLARPLGSSWTTRFHKNLYLFKMAGIAVLILGFARPQLGSAEEDILTEGVDIMIAIDISGSMAAEDFRPKNRISVAKQVVKDFVQGRRSDRIGLVIFAAKSFTKCPLTIDYDVLLRQIDDVHLGAIEDGTAIGNGLATAINRLRLSKAKSRVIILLTDGVNNSGEIDPLTAADIAQSLGIKVYTVGVGKEGIAPFPVNDPVFGKRYVDVEVQIDEGVLQKMAQMTSGKYFRAVDRDSLEQIFKTIDGLEKSKISVKSYTHYNEIFSYFLWPGLGLLLGEAVLSNTRFRKVP
ncbi:MAG: aerotolerance regulator BatA [Acidobacteria bacterium]|nr:MAG: aerotolerance regulator BatA [Acidobacteriota bacterium]